MSDLPAAKFTAELKSVEALSDSIYALRVSLPEPMGQNQKFDYISGQYCCLGLENEPEALRSYSIANAPNGEYLEFHIRDNGRGFTRVLCDADKLGDSIFLSEAFGSMRYHKEPNHDVVMFAGGTGYAPIRSILESFAAQGFDRQTSVFIGGRDAASLYMRDELAQFKRALKGLEVYYCADELDDSGDAIHQGSLMDIADRDMPPLNGRCIYIAGPPAMVINLQDYVLNKGGEKALIYLDQENVERFLKCNKG